MESWGRVPFIRGGRATGQITLTEAAMAKAMQNAIEKAFDGSNELKNVMRVLNDYFDKKGFWIGEGQTNWFLYSHAGEDSQGPFFTLSEALQAALERCEAK